MISPGIVPGEIFQMRALFLIGLLTITQFVCAQNLVPNPSFENYDSCPRGNGNLFCTPWYSPTMNSPDYLNACWNGVTTDNMDVPVNRFGSEPAHTGQAYAGVYTVFSTPSSHEYVSVKLLDSLKQGARYCVEFYATLGDSSWGGVNYLGAHLSATPDTMYAGYYLLRLPFQPQIEYDTILTDTSGWTKISGAFVAQGGEMYITIGIFAPDSALTYDSIQGDGSVRFSYYFIDDVSVYEIQLCDAGNDISICYQDSIQIGTTSKPGVVYSWFPTIAMSDPNCANPKVAPDSATSYILTQTECDVISHDTVTVLVRRDCNSAANIVLPTLLYGGQLFFIHGLETNSSLELFDVRGRLVYSNKDYSNDFWTGSLDQGTYVARLTRPTGEVVSRKFVLVK